MKLKKAAGPDQICPFMIKYGGDRMIEILVMLFNHILIEKKAPESGLKV